MNPTQDASTAVSYPALWFTSGSVLDLGQRQCAYERWLRYHAGRHGTGYQRRATAVPLATGAAVHQGLGLIGEWILEWQAAHPAQHLTAVPDEVTAWAATEAADCYEHRARTRGLELTKTDSTAAAAIEQLILEQRTLIEAQVWIYALGRLPVLLSTYRVLNVEHEEGPVITCTCGLGDWVGQWDAHASRGCAGIVAQGRGDLLLEPISGQGGVIYEELKTKSTPNYGWDQGWEHSGQLWLNMEAASRRLGRPVNQAFVPVLYKGRRAVFDRQDPTAPKVQQSPLVYGWYDPGNAMTRAPEWASQYKWYDEWGKGHTLPRTYTRTPIWDPQTPLDSPMPNGDVTLTAHASRVERWVKGWITPRQYADLLKVLGPFPQPAVLVPEAARGVVAEEQMWRNRVEYLRERKIYQPHDGFGSMTTAADVIPRSWACTKFDGTPCAFKRVCHREPGWEDIEALDEYEIRTPHHAIEKQAMTAYVESLGLTWPDDEDEETDE